MWLSDRRIFLIGLAALAGCGFQPAYGPGSPVRGILGTIRVDDPADKNGFDLVERLEERLGRPDNARFGLAYVLRVEQQGLGVTPENAITRYHVTGRVDWKLRDLATGTQVASGSADRFTAYSATGSTIGTLAAQQDASLRLMRILADQIVTQLMAGAAQMAP